MKGYTHSWKKIAASIPISLGSDLITQQIVHLWKPLNKFKKHMTKVSLPVGYTLISKELLTQETTAYF